MPAWTRLSSRPSCRLLLDGDFHRYASSLHACKVRRQLRRGKEHVLATRIIIPILSYIYIILSIYILSRSLPNPIGVFQGSSLGPLLFQIFANDLALYAPQAHVVQYADDTQVLVSGKKDSLPQLIATMEHALSCNQCFFFGSFSGIKVNLKISPYISANIA